MKNRTESCQSPREGLLNCPPTGDGTTEFGAYIKTPVSRLGRCHIDTPSRQYRFQGIRSFGWSFQQEKFVQNLGRWGYNFLNAEQNTTLFLAAGGSTTIAQSIVILILGKRRGSSRDWPTFRRTKLAGIANSYQSSTLYAWGSLYRISFCFRGSAATGPNAPARHGALPAAPQSLPRLGRPTSVLAEISASFCCALWSRLFREKSKFVNRICNAQCFQKSPCMTICASSIPFVAGSIST